MSTVVGIIKTNLLVALVLKIFIRCSALENATRLVTFKNLLFFFLVNTVNKHEKLKQMRFAFASLYDKLGSFKFINGVMKPTFYVK